MDMFSYMWASFFAQHRNQSNCWVCGQLCLSASSGLPWWMSPLQGGIWKQYTQQWAKRRPLAPLAILILVQKCGPLPTPLMNPYMGTLFLQMKLCIYPINGLARRNQKWHCWNHGNLCPNLRWLMYLLQTMVTWVTRIPYVGNKQNQSKQNQPNCTRIWDGYHQISMITLLFKISLIGLGQTGQAIWAFNR